MIRNYSRKTEYALLGLEIIEDILEEPEVELVENNFRNTYQIALIMYNKLKNTSIPKLRISKIRKIPPKLRSGNWSNS